MGVRRGAIPLDLFGIECNTYEPASDGCEWLAWFESGWDSPDLRGGELEPTGRHGVARLPQLAGGRSLVIGGRVKAPTTEDAWDAYNRVTSSMPALNEEGTVVLHEPVPKMLVLGRGREPRATEPEAGRFEFRLALLAEFPFKRAVTEKSVTLAGSASLENAGSTAAYPLVTVTSAGTVDLVVGTRHFTTTTLPVGAVIDMWARTVTAVDGSSLYGAKSAASEWIALPPGSTLVGQDGTAGVDLTWHDTYG